MGDVGYRTKCDECGHLHCCIDSSWYWLPCRQCDCERRPGPEHNSAWEFAQIWTDGDEGPHDWGTPDNPRVTVEQIPLVSEPGSALRRWLPAGGERIDR